MLKKLKYLNIVGPDIDWIGKFKEFLFDGKSKVMSFDPIQRAFGNPMEMNDIKNLVMQFYPLIWFFPKWLAINLSEANDVPVRNFFIDALRVEKRHLQDWVEMGRVLGVSEDELKCQHKSIEVESLICYLTFLHHHEPLSARIVSLNCIVDEFGKEISRRILEQLAEIVSKNEINADWKSLKWVKKHANYTEKYNNYAFEILALLELDEEEKAGACQVAERTMDYFQKTLASCLPK